jgi:hypothetical protein
MSDFCLVMVVGVVAAAVAVDCWWRSAPSPPAVSPPTRAAPPLLWLAVGAAELQLTYQYGVDEAAPAWTHLPLR